MNLTFKDLIIFATIFSLGVAIYMGGSVLNDYDIVIAQLQSDVQELREVLN